ncbi:MAG: metallophosphoesterase [Propionibacteriales bacterium]|nr:metallophosphoesterase [Propionibacteriales bacterium]
MLIVALVAVVATALLGLSHVYLWRRLVRDTSPDPRLRKVGTVLVVALGLLVPATLVGVPTGIAEPLAWPGYLWIGLLFYLLLFLVLLEVPRLVLLRWRAPSDGAEPAEDPGRRLLIARGVALVAGVAATGTVAHGVRTALGPPVLDRQQLLLPRLPRSMDGTRLVVVSDIHLGPLLGEGHVARIVDRINDLDADVVAIVGDLVDGSVAERGPGAAPLAGIRSRHGTFFVTGNHDYYSGHEEWIERLDELGVRTLRNERTELRIRGGALDLAGVNDLTGRDYDDGPDFEKTFADRDPDRPVVLMAHQPVQARSAARYGVDLQVSGHTHGGQMAPFGRLARLEQPVVSGLGDVDGVPVYVTNGAGFWGPPVRVGAPPQVTLLQLRSP